VGFPLVSTRLFRAGFFASGPQLGGRAAVVTVLIEGLGQGFFGPLLGLKLLNAVSQAILTSK
jgi:hypothetical protein